MAKKRAAAKKKTTARRTPKVRPSKKVAARVSPLRGMSVDAWAKRLEGWQAEALDRLRALVKRHAPAATCTIKWGQPVWEHNGPFAWARPAAQHVSFGFWRGAELSDPKGVLEGDGDRMRHVKITSATQIARLPMAALIKQAVSLNARKGNPTRVAASG
jgi:hypothetical protein